MDKRKSVLNVSVSIAFKIVTMITSIIVKRILIQSCGNEVNGLNALYLSIIGFLAVAELGVGGAITFCMYRPIVEGDNNKVSALYHLFRRLYLIIGGVILFGGLCITPFIPYLAKDYPEIDVNLYVTFVLMLISVVLTYVFGAKTSLINAYKNNYITTAITSGGFVLQHILQIIVLLVTRSFVWYLICRIVAATVQWIATEIVTKNKYPIILSNRQKVDDDTKKELVKNIKAMFMHKVGGVLVNSADSVIISMFVGVIALGEYSNYTTLLAALTSILNLCFSSLTSVIGHLYVEENKEASKTYCEAFHLINFIIGTVFFCGYYAVVDSLISVLFSAELVLPKSISFVITLNGFVQFMRTSTLTFRDATGTFYYDRWKPLAEGIVNVILSILFVHWFGVTGVILATIGTNLLICHVVEPNVLYKNAFSISPKRFYFKNYSMIAVFIITLIALDLCLQETSNIWTQFFVNGFLSLGISLLVCGVVMLLNKRLCKHILHIFKRGKQ